MTHSIEPWVVESEENNLDFEMDMKVVSGSRAICHFYDLSPEDVSNANRIVACVNACAGIKTQDLEAMRGTSILEKANASFDSVQKQRDELLSVLEDLLRQGDFFLTAIEAKDGWSSDFEELERRARKAIAKVKGE